MANGFDEILRGVSIKRSRSPLEPYRSLVEELHRRGLSLREIAGVLAQRCNVQTSHVAIHKLLQHKYPRPFDLTRQRSTSHVEVGKSVKDGATDTASVDFHFDPDVPLKLSPKDIRKA